MTTKPFSELTKNISPARKAAIAAETAQMLKEIAAAKTTQNDAKTPVFAKG